MISKKCLNCEKEFIREPRHRNNWQLKKYCSQRCSREYNYRVYQKVRRQQTQFLQSNPKTICASCGTEFLMKTRRSKYCSALCRARYRIHKCLETEYLRSHSKKCLYCKKEFYASRSDQKMCSNKCSQANWNRLHKFIDKPSKYKYERYLYGSKKRNLVFDLSEEDFLTIVKQPCYYCNSLQQAYNGIDRLNNRIGYTKENSVPCCKRCNFLKGRYTEEEFAKGIIECYLWAINKVGATNDQT